MVDIKRSPEGSMATIGVFKARIAPWGVGMSEEPTESATVSDLYIFDHSSHLAQGRNLANYHFGRFKHPVSHSRAEHKVVPNLSMMLFSSSNTPISMSIPSYARRSFIVGILLCPPECTLGSSPSCWMRKIASLTELTLRYSNTAG